MISKQQAVLTLSLGVGATGLLATPANADITLYEKDDKSLKIGGRIQPQYRLVDPEEGSSTDDFFLRRFRIEIQGTLTKDWAGAWQIDFGEEGNEPEVKDAFLQYQGLAIGDVTIGNHYVPFSREAITSSKRQQLVERTFVGDHNFGVPDRQMGISLKGGDMLQYWVGVYNGGLDPSASKLDFEPRVNADAEYFGPLVGGRVDFFPFGEVKFAQGDFEQSDFKLGVGVNAFTWNNDDDQVVDGGGDYDEVTGAGVDVAVRMAGLSVDVAYQTFTSETVDKTFTDGIIQNGEGDFDTYAIEGGYMIVPDTLELVAGYQVLDIDALEDQDQRVSVGLNYFFNKYDDKVQLTYEIGTKVFATDGNTESGEDQNRLFIQFQHLI